MIANKEKCANQDKNVCEYSDVRRLRYFHGMLLDDKDFQAEQDYHTNKRRFLNRMLHGSGVVCGLDLTGKKEGRSIDITSGLALDCAGNEVWVPRTITIDLATILPRKDKSNLLECQEEDADPQKLTPYWIAVSYDQKPSNPVSVYLPSGSCEDRSCENSRIKEGFCVELLKDCPNKTPEVSTGGLLEAFCKCDTDDQYDKDYDPMCDQCGELEGANKCKCKQLEKFCEQSVPCPECCSCDKPCYVVLGKIEVDKECRLRSICINDCRSYVLTGRMIQHLLVSMFAGAEQYLYVGGKKVEDLKVREVARNPIEALCWLLRKSVIEGGDFEFNLCGIRDQPQDGEIKNRVDAMQAEMEKVRADNAELSAQMKKVLEVSKLQPVAKTGGSPETEKAAPVETAEKTPKTPKSPVK